MTWFRSAAERFEEKIEPEPNSGCILWVGKRDSHGYGQFTVDGHTGALVHRWSWAHANGPIPTGYEIDHLCRVRCCVNPAHLDAVPPRVNNARNPDSASTVNSLKTSCPSGHAYDALEHLRSGEVRRRCRVCQRAINRRSYAKRVAERTLKEA